MTEYTWADLEAAVGQVFPGEDRIGADPVEWSGIRRFCEPIELGCPIHYDEAVARANGYRGVVLPVSAISSTYPRPPLWRPGSPTKWDTKQAHAVLEDTTSRASERPTPRGILSFVTDIEIEYFEPVCVGDRLTAKGGSRLLSVKVRETSVGFGAFSTSESYIYNQRNELVAVQRNGGYSYIPHSPERLAEIRAQQAGAAGPPQTSADPPPSGLNFEELARMKQPRADWSNQLYWDDVREGDLVPPVAMNITLQRLVIEAGANRDFSAVHFDRVLAQQSGAEEVYANNVFIQGMWERCVREYIGVAGRIKKVGPFRIRNFNEIGMTAVTMGKAVRKFQEDRKNLLEMEVWTENDRNGRTVSVGPGPVVVELPLRR